MIIYKIQYQNNHKIHQNMNINIKMNKLQILEIYNILQISIKFNKIKIKIKIEIEIENMHILVMVIYHLLLHL